MKPSATRHRLLLINADSRSLGILRVSLLRADHDVVTAGNGPEALRALGAYPFDLVIADADLTDLPIVDLGRRVAEAQAGPVPIIALARQPSVDERARGFEAGVEDFLAKPVYPRELVARVQLLLQRALRARLEAPGEGKQALAGLVADVGVIDLLQSTASSGRPGVVKLVADDGRQGTLHFRGGRIVDAQAGRLDGEAAVYRLLGWSDGAFEVQWRSHRRPEVIAADLPALLEEGMRRLDAVMKLLEAMPPLDAVFMVDFAVLTKRIGELPREVVDLLRLFDGRRTVVQAMHDSDLGDLEALTVIHALYHDRLLPQARRALEASAEDDDEDERPALPPVRGEPLKMLPPRPVAAPPVVSVAAPVAPPPVVSVAPPAPRSRAVPPVDELLDDDLQDRAAARWRMFKVAGSTALVVILFGVGVTLTVTRRAAAPMVVVAPAPVVPPPPPAAVAVAPAPAPVPEPAPAPAAEPAPAPAAEPAPAVAAAEPAPAEDAEAMKAHCRDVAGGGAARYGAVMKACQPAADADPKDVGILLLLARTEADHGGNDRALDWARRAISLDPTVPDAYLYAGTAHQAAGHTKDARAAYQKYIELAPTGKYAADLRAVLKSL